MCVCGGRGGSLTGVCSETGELGGGGAGGGWLVHATKGEEGEGTSRERGIEKLKTRLICLGDVPQQLGWESLGL